MKLLLWLVVLVACQRIPAEVKRDEPLRSELLALVEEDQQVRNAFIAKQDDPARATAMQAFDRKATARMKQIVAKYGWPGKKLVGDEAAQGAWLLVQHADAEPAFQKQCLALLERAVAAGDAEAQHHAYLYDRVAVGEGRPQRWGTQFGADGEPAPIEDAANVDTRRKQIGLPTLAEYKAKLREIYGPPKQ